MSEKPSSSKRELFEREAMPHLDALYRVALFLSRDLEDANDLVQETVLRAYRFFRRYTPGTNCRVWLLTILHNSFCSRYHSSGRENAFLSPEELSRELEKVSCEEAPNDPETLLSEHILDHEIVLALAALPLEFRKVLILVDVQELDYKEVAQVLAIPIGTVKSRVSRARQMLRTALAGFARERRLVH